MPSLEELMDIHDETLAEFIHDNTTKSSPCKITPTKVWLSTWNLIKKWEDLDSFVKYTISNDIWIERWDLQSLKLKDLISEDYDWRLIWLKENYIKIKNYILNYFEQDDYMWFFWLLYWMWDYSNIDINDIEWLDRIEIDNNIKNFNTLKSKIKSDAYKFFDIIEWESTAKETRKEYINRLLWLVKWYWDSNDVMLFVALNPKWQSILKDRKLFENYFNIDISDTKTFNTIFWTESKKARIWQHISYSLYDELPECVQEYFYTNKLLLKDSIWDNLTKLDVISINQFTFNKLTPKEQLQLYNMVLDSYKAWINWQLYYDKTVSIDERIWDKDMFWKWWDDRELWKWKQYEVTEEEIKHLEQLHQKILWEEYAKQQLNKKWRTTYSDWSDPYDDIKAAREAYFIYKYWLEKKQSYIAWYNAAERYINASNKTDFWSNTNNYNQALLAQKNAEKLAREVNNKLYSFFKFKFNRWNIEQWIWRAMKALTNWRIYSLLLMLSNWREWALAMIILNSLQFMSRKWARDYARFWLEWDLYKFIYDFKLADPDIAKFYSDAWTDKWLKSVYNASKKIAEKIIDANFFNIADITNDVHATVWYVKKYMNSKFPRMTNINEYYNYLSSLSKEARAEERIALTEYIDREKNLMHNLSFDQNRNTDYWRYVNKWQSYATIFSRLWNFFREYMKASWRHYFQIAKEWRKSPSWAMITEWIEQYYDWRMTRKELDWKIFEAFTKNEDFNRLWYSLLVSIFIAKTITKADVHNNWMEENDIDDDIISMFVWFIKDFWFPLAAFERTDLWMLLKSAMETASREYSPKELAVAEATEVSKTWLKQLSKWLYRFRFLSNLSWKYRSMFSDEDLAELWIEPEWFIEKHLDMIASSIKDTVWSFWRFLQNDITDTWFQQDVPKTHSSLMRLYQWVRDFTKDAVIDAEKIAKYKYQSSSLNNYLSWLLYNLPFIWEYKRWLINTSTDDDFNDALMELNEQKYYRTMAVERRFYNKNEITDNQWMFFFNQATQHNKRSTNKMNWLAIDKSFVWDDWTLVENRRENIKEKLFDKELKWLLSEKEYKAALDAIESTDKDYNIDALRTLLWTETKAHMSWIQIIWYLMSQEVVKNVYSKKYPFWKKDENWNIIDEVWFDRAMRTEQINAAKKYAEYVAVVDEQIWAQYILRITKDKDLKISKMLTSSWDNERSSIWFSSIWREWFKNSSWKEMYEITLYTDMQAWKWDPNAYAYNNFLWHTFSSTRSYNNDPNVILWNYNYLFDRIWNYWISPLVKSIHQWSVVMRSDEAMSALTLNRPIWEVLNDEWVQLWLRNLYWTLDIVNELWERAALEKVNKVRDWLDPSNVYFSFITETNWKKNRKHYYYDNKYFFDQLRMMWKKYEKYYNRFYPYKIRHATPTYSQREREAKWFNQIMWSVNRWWWKKKSWSWRKQEQPWWYITQRRWKARPFTNRWDLDRIPDRKTKPRNRRTRWTAIGSKLWNRLIPWRRRYVKQLKRDLPTIT